MFQPACHVPPFRIVVRPVDLTSLFVPDVLAVEAYAIARLQPVDPRCDVDVVQNKDRLTRCQADDESLMPAATKVVRQYACYYAFAFNLDIARPVLERACDLTVVTRRATILTRGLKRAITACADQGTYNDRGNEDPFHNVITLPTVSETTHKRRSGTREFVCQISIKSLPTMICPLNVLRAPSIHIWSVTAGSSGGTKCESTRVFTPAAVATRPASSAEV